MRSVGLRAGKPVPAITHLGGYLPDAAVDLAHLDPPFNSPVRSLPPC